MSDFPYMQFFAGDWMSDPKLSMCSPATRGFWMDALCAMHAAGRVGELSGTTNQLARVCRCLPAEASTAIADLRSTTAADVTERNGIVTLVCRRMKRDAEKRKSNNDRQKKHRNGGVTPEDEDESRNGNADITGTRALNLESESEEANASKKENRTRGTKEELMTYAVGRGLPATDGEWLFDKMLTQAWKVDGKPVKDWQALIRVWQRNGYFPSQKTGANGHAAPAKPRAPDPRAGINPADFTRWLLQTYPRADPKTTPQTADFPIVQEFLNSRKK